MSECNWDPKKHGGRPCPKHGKIGYWDENILTRREKLKAAGYTQEEINSRHLAESGFDNDESEDNLAEGAYRAYISSDYGRINNACRNMFNNKKAEDNEEELYREQSDYLAFYIYKNGDIANRDMTLYRISGGFDVGELKYILERNGIEFKSLQDVKNNLGKYNNLLRNNLQLQQFESTSNTRNGFNDNPDSKRQFRIIFRIPKGTPNIEGRELENEVILPPGLTWKPKKFYMDGDMLTLKADIIQADPKLPTVFKRTNEFLKR